MELMVGMLLGLKLPLALALVEGGTSLIRNPRSRPLARSTLEGFSIGGGSLETGKLSLFNVLSTSNT